MNAYEGATSIEAAFVRLGDTDQVKFFLKKGGDVDSQIQGGRGNILFLEASSYGQTDIVNVLIQAGANVEFQDNDGCSPLHVASQNGHTEIAKLLIEASAINVESLTNEGLTPLHVASQNGHIEIVKLLLKAKANIGIQDSLHWTPLYTATANGHTEIVKLFIKVKANVGIPSNEGVTPLYIAS